jgi:lipopolysaccharide export system ATP-binding protein
MSLIARHLVKRYGKRTVVNDISFSLEAGEIVGLLGPNGAGKTTSFYALVGLVKPDEGDVELDGQSVSALPIHERARAGLGYLPQESSIFAQLTVEENMRLVLEFQNLSSGEQQARSDQLLEEFGIAHLRQAQAIKLSGGEKRRLEIARAIACNPKYLLLDEPFTGIDPITIQDIQQLIVLLKQKGLGILMTDHNPMATLSIVDRAYIIYDGKVFRSGSAQEISEDPLVKEYYLGSDFVLAKS